MKNEASDTTMLAVTVIALAVVVVIGFGIFQYARSILNTGSNNLTGALDTVNASAFTDYDQKPASANQVLAAFQNFDGTSTAILVRTKALMVADNAVTSSVTATGNTRYFIGATDGTGTTLKDDDGNDKIFINYNALLMGDTTFTKSTAAATNKMKLTDGVYTFSKGYYSIGGVVQFYNVMTNINKTGMTEYIAAGSKFNANLIKDDSGTILGVVFEQVN